MSGDSLPPVVVTAEGSHNLLACKGTELTVCIPTDARTPISKNLNKNTVSCRSAFKRLFLHKTKDKKPSVECVEEMESDGGPVAQEASTKRNLEGWFPITSRISCLAMPTTVRSQWQCLSPGSGFGLGIMAVDLSVFLGAHFYLASDCPVSLQQFQASSTAMLWARSP